MKAAFQALKTWLEGKFPQIPVRLNWPETFKGAEYPFISIITADWELIKYQPRVVSTAPVVYMLGEFRGNFSLHYFAKEEEDLLDFQESALNALKGNDPKEENRSIEIDYGQPWESMTISPMAFRRIQAPFGLQTGRDRRLIVDFRFSLGDFGAFDRPVMTDIRLDGEVGEDKP